MYQRKAPTGPADAADVQAVVRELAGVLAATSAVTFPTATHGGSPKSSLSSLPRAVVLPAPVDEPQMPIPSTWREPQGLAATPLETAPWRTGLLGLLVGLCLTVPTVLWLTGHAESTLVRLGLRPPPAVEAPLTSAAAAEVAWPVSASRGATEPVASDGTATPPAPGNESPAGMLTTAELLIAGGDVILARNLLERSASTGDANILFALAETHDPNMLAAWGVRDLRADPDQARSLYQRALSGGVERARARLRGLQ